MILCENVANVAAVILNYGAVLLKILIYNLQKKITNFTVFIFCKFHYTFLALRL